MPVHIKFIIKNFIKTFLFVLSIIYCLVLILNLINELDFFENINVSGNFIIYLVLLNTPISLFEILPFVILISTQLFFINFSKYKEIDIFKYTGFSNKKILLILSAVTIAIGYFAIFFFHSFSSNLKNIYINSKKQYTSDGKYLAVITKNGLWIKDVMESKNYIINAEKIEKNFLISVFISEFDENYNILRNIKTPKVNIKDFEWTITDATLLVSNEITKLKELKLKTNFKYSTIQELYSNLSTLSLLELFQLKKNYKKINYSLIDIDFEIIKLFTYPIYLLMMVIFSSCLMLKTTFLQNKILKISIGLISAVVFFYLNNFFAALGKTEKLNIFISALTPIIILSVINFFLIVRINEK